MSARFFFALVALVLLAVAPAGAASFDCSAASSPFEHAICDSPELSAADERLARSYETAIGGLSAGALEAVRADQRAWLDHARRACNRGAEPLGEGRYDERGLSCLVEIFTSRARMLETSRMIDGLRFYPLGIYAAFPDPDAEDIPEFYWPVARHELSFVQIDAEEGFAQAFNAVLRAEAERLAEPFLTIGDVDEGADDDTSDSSDAIYVKEVAGEGRITLALDGYWYGHGAAHGNYSISYLHYLRQEGRMMAAGDLFAGKGWDKALLRLAVAALEAEHGDNLMLSDTRYIADAVIDPTRWELSDPYSLVIQFQPYEVSAYAYGAPTARIPWEKLEDYLTDTADLVRYGY